MIKIKKIELTIIIFTIFLLCSCTDIKFKNDVNNVDVTKEESFKFEKNMADTEVIKFDLESVSKNIRNFGSEGELITTGYIKKVLEDNGYKVQFQKFDVYKQDLESTFGIKSNLEFLDLNPYNSESLGTGINVIGEHNNKDESKKTLYLTAHHDSTSNTTGVIDNASGVAVVLQLARLLNAYNNNDFNIEFIFFGAEEYYKFGSRYFVSSLSDKEKENILGCINIDMVGEIGAGDIVMQTYRGYHNYMSLLFKDSLEIDLGGGSDEVSFYMGKIPSITITNKESNPMLSLEENQIKYIDVNQLKDISEHILEAILNFDIDICDNYKVISDDDLNSEFPILDGFKLIEKNQVLIEDGYDSEMVYIYKNYENKEYKIIERHNIFMPELEGSDLVVLDDINGYKYIIDNSDNTKIFFDIKIRQGEIYGDITKEQAIEILEKFTSFN